MVNRLTVILLAMAVAALFVISAHAQEDMETVNDTAFGDPMRPPVAFQHDDHNEAAGIDDCTVCHHLHDENGTLLEDESSEDMECGECHGKDANGFPMELVKAFHLNCRGCHEAEKAGPVVCAECHRKP